MQLTQATSLLEITPKIVFDIGCNHLALNMPVVLSIYALHM
jgi:hypothetical protein